MEKARSTAGLFHYSYDYTPAKGHPIGVPTLTISVIQHHPANPKRDSFDGHPQVSYIFSVIGESTWHAALLPGKGITSFRKN